MPNIFGSFMSSYAGSGSFTRSGLSFESDARTPLFAIFSAIILMIIVLLIVHHSLPIYPLLRWRMLSLMVVYNLIDFHHIRETLSFSVEESAILITTSLAILFLELEFAIYLDVLLSLVLFLSKISTPVTFLPYP